MVRKGASGGECYGEYSGGTGSGAGYVNSCVHSGIVTGTSDNVVWYNYGAATAGTIVDTSNTSDANNTKVTTESVCPKGWSLPTEKQMKIIGDTSGSTTYYDVFNPTVGGRYYNGSLQDGPTIGYWWGAGAANGARRYMLYNNSSVLITNVSHRYVGYYIRCVSEEKDVSDLTYMQDMTPSVATLPTILQELCVIVNVLRA